MKKQRNDNIYLENLKLLKKNYPEVAVKVENCTVGESYEMRGTGKNKNVNVFCKKLNRFYYDENNPLEGVREQLNSLNIRNAKIALFLGFGLGYELDLYAKEFSENALTRLIVVVERDVELFKIALHMFDYRPLLSESKIKLVIGVPLEEFLPIINDFFSVGTRIVFSKAIFPIYMDASIQQNKDYYMGVLKEIKQAVPYVLRYFGNSPEDSLIGVENMLENIEEIIKNPGINLLYNKFNKKPAIVVATGPSLSKNKHLLKGMEDKALIISVDASLKILKEIDVTPHLVTSLERVPLTAKLMEGFEPESVKDVYYAACPVIPRAAYEAYPGPRIIVYRNFDHFKWIELDKGILDIKHSSANMAFKIATALGCDPIILIGQDLAYGSEGKSHAKGATLGEEQVAFNQTDQEGELWVRGNEGGLVKTHSTWDEFRRAYEVDIAHYQGTCINATEGGAKIQGAKIMTLEKALDLYAKEIFNPLDTIKSTLAGFTVEDEKRDLERILNLISYTKSNLINIQDMCMKAFEIIKKRENEYKKVLENDESSCEVSLQSQVSEDFKMINTIKSDIFNVQPTMQLFLMHIFQPYYIKHEMDGHEIPSIYESKLKIEIASILLHKGFFAVLHDLISVCNESLERTNVKLKELNLEDEMV